MSNAEKVVMVPRKPTPAMLEAMRAPCGETMDGYPNPATFEERYTAAIDAAPEQHQGEPVALPERKPNAWQCADGIYPANGYNVCLDEIAKLGPLYTHADPTSPFEVLAEHCAKSAIAEGITNYRGASYTISQDDGGAFELVITVQRLGAKSPQEVNEELGREVERLRGLNRDALTELEDRKREIYALRAQLAELRSAAQPIYEGFAEYNAMCFEPCKETFTQPGTGREVENGVTVRVRLLNELGAALSASAEPNQQLVECDACPRSSGCVETCMKAPASAEPSAPGERDGLEGVEDVARSIVARIQARAALSRK